VSEMTAAVLSDSTRKLMPGHL